MARKAKTTKAKKLPKQKFYWHFMRNDGTLGYHDDRKPKLGEWTTFIPSNDCSEWNPKKRTFDPITKPILCRQGMHASLALKGGVGHYTPGIRLARVELGKIFDADKVKAVSDKRRTIETWTPHQVRNAILTLAREKVATMVKKEMAWWLKNCPFVEVQEAIKSGDMEKFQTYKKWLSVPMGYGVPVPLASFHEGHRHLLGRGYMCGDDLGIDYPDPRFKENLVRFEERLKKEKQTPIDADSSRNELEMLEYLFKNGVTEKKFLEVLGSGRKVKK